MKIIIKDDFFKDSEVVDVEHMFTLVLDNGNRLKISEYGDGILIYSSEGKVGISPMSSSALFVFAKRSFSCA